MKAQRHLLPFRFILVVLLGFSVAVGAIAGDPGTQKWAFATGTGSAVYGCGSPAIGPDGTVYSARELAYLYAVNADGTQRWVTTINGVKSPAIGPDGTVYVGSDDTKLYAFTADGTKKWDYKTFGKITGAPAIAADGTIYVGSEDGYLYALNPDGTKKWNVVAPPGNPARLRGAPAIGRDGTVYLYCNRFSLIGKRREGGIRRAERRHA